MESISYFPGDILRETAPEIRRPLEGKIEGLTVDKAVIGLFFYGS